ncbi:hypothetical protein [Mycolicibacterium fallax]|uniref:hypothetical protein n=1 Tax=Mycolicibacterium fallax TaxID=1793 RepID=UPI0021F39E77|nr:hypothetical protein [Mycolicibacterium fallax]
MDQRARHTAAVAALVALAVAGCSGGETATAVTETVTVTQTVENTVTVTGSPTSAPAPATTTSTSAAPVIDQVQIVTTDLGGGRVGPDRYQLDRTYSHSTPTVNVKYGWSALQGGTEIGGSSCTVVATVTGPGDYSHTEHSDACSRSASSIRGKSIGLTATGTYTITVSVTPKDGAEFTGTSTLEVIPMDNP